MQVNISARHGQLSPETQEKISQKVEKLRRFFDRVTAIDATVDLEHHESPSVELRLSVERTDYFVATETASNVIAAVDGAIQKIEQQLRKHKEKRRGHKAPGLKRVEPNDSSDEEG